MDKLRLFELDVTARVEIRRRDEFGWVDGYGPGNGKYHDPKVETYRYVCAREGQARERVADYYQGDHVKDFEVVAVREIPLHGVMVELA